ncbi:hypothetical protein RJ640_024532, partial [Escallonia rubra]
MDSPETNKKGSHPILLRCIFILLFSLFAVLSVSLTLVGVSVLAGYLSITSPISVPSQCKIVSSIVALTWTADADIQNANDAGATMVRLCLAAARMAPLRSCLIGWPNGRAQPCSPSWPSSRKRISPVFPGSVGVASRARPGRPAASDTFVQRRRVDLRSSKVCELGLLNYKAKHVFYPSEKKKFRCWFDYYWASVFKVEYTDHSGQTQLALAEAPSEALPPDCRPTFDAAWLTKDKFKVNGTYDCWYSLGISKVNIYHDGFFNCLADHPSTTEMLRRYSI